MPENIPQVSSLEQTQEIKNETMQCLADLCVDVSNNQIFKDEKGTEYRITPNMHDEGVIQKKVGEHWKTINFYKNPKEYARLYALYESSYQSYSTFSENTVSSQDNPPFENTSLENIPHPPSQSENKNLGIIFDTPNASSPPSEVQNSSQNIPEIDIPQNIPSSITSEQKEISGNSVVISSSDQLSQVLSSPETPPGTTLLLESGSYAGNFLLKNPNLTISAKDPNNPPHFPGGSKESTFDVVSSGNTFKNLFFEGGNIGIRARGAGNTVENCRFTNMQIYAVHAFGDNNHVRGCTIDQFHKDGVFIQGQNVSVENTQIVGYLGQDDAHNDCIQIAAQGDQTVRGAGDAVMNNIRITGCTLDSRGTGRNLQGIGAFQCMLNNAEISNNTIAVDSTHGITCSPIGNTRITNNVIKSYANGSPPPKINILPSRPSNSPNGWILQTKDGKPIEYHADLQGNRYEGLEGDPCMVDKACKV